ncbi:hypothetical protein FRC17_004644 [Serendipita sp. 399]|nr:hypothetical protein FRC17_004644 [Serendipita sp. 399]
MASPLLFSTFVVTKQAFFRTSTTAAIVNLKPLVPGQLDIDDFFVIGAGFLGRIFAYIPYKKCGVSTDILVIPNRVVPRFADLTPSEVASLFTSVQVVGKVVQTAYQAEGLTIACQDGKAAGQSVPHVHVHIIPRKASGDRFANNDNVYPELETQGSTMQDAMHQASSTPEGASSTSFNNISDRGGFMIDDELRKPRSLEDMEKEAEWLRSFFEDQSEE